jgi:hypothetical protein
MANRTFPLSKVYGQQLLPKGKVLEQEFFSGAKDGDDPAEQTSGLALSTATGR